LRAETSIVRLYEPIGCPRFRVAPGPSAVRWLNRASPIYIDGEPEFGSLSSETGEEEAAADLRHAPGHILLAVAQPALDRGCGVEPATVVLEGCFEEAQGGQHPGQGQPRRLGQRPEGRRLGGLSPADEAIGTSFQLEQAS